MSQHRDGFDEFRLFPSAAETDPRIGPAAESVGNQRDGVHPVDLQTIEYRDGRLWRISHWTLGGEIDSLLEKDLSGEQIGERDTAQQGKGGMHHTGHATTDNRAGRGGRE